MTNGTDRPNSITYWLTSGNDREKFGAFDDDDDDLVVESNAAVRI